MKKYLQSMAHKLGWIINRDIPFHQAHIRYQPDYQLLIEGLMATGQKPVLVEIGAFDGIYNEPLRSWLKSGAFRGLLVEPQPEVYQALVSNYADVPDLAFEQAAVSSENGTSLFWQQKVASDSNSKLEGKSISSLQKDHLLRHTDTTRGGKIEAITVKTYTFDSLLEKHGITNFDLLQVDAEGADYKILSEIDFSRHHPSIICFEHAHMTFSQLNHLLGQLAKLGYRFTQDHVNTILVHPERYQKSRSEPSAKPC